MGKTGFLNYVFFELRGREPPPTVVIDITEDFVLVESNGTTRIGHRACSFREDLNRPDTFYLFKSATVLHGTNFWWWRPVTE